MHAHMYTHYAETHSVKVERALFEKGEWAPGAKDRIKVSKIHGKLE